MFSCSVCCEIIGSEKMQQFTPCLHVFCERCVGIWKAAQKAKTRPKSRGSPSSPVRKILPPVVCLASNCFSMLDESCARRLNWKRCESPFCCRQLSAVRLERLPCKHQVCPTCMEEYKQSSPPACPVEGCCEKLPDEDDTDLCDGNCRKHLEEGKYVTTKCCQAKVCFACFETIFGHKYVPGQEEKCPNECLRQPEVVECEPMARCKAGIKCKNVAINGFPSKGECEHGICMSCLDQMVDECEAVGSLPRCPNEACNALYGTESVIAMRAMLPEKASFFEKLSLDSGCYYPIRDETITPILFSADFKSADRYLECSVRLSDGSEGKKFSFDREGTVGDLVREVRRELKIGPEEKVYGYYMLRSSSAEDKLDGGGIGGPAEKLEFNAESVFETVEKLRLSSAVTIVADTTGIVQAKSDAALGGGGGI